MVMIKTSLEKYVFWIHPRQWWLIAASLRILYFWVKSHDRKNKAMTSRDIAKVTTISRHTTRITMDYN